MRRMSSLYPLRFEPILRRYLWGGRRLGETLGKPIGEGDDYAESWEVCDRAGDQSLVATGPLRGRPLGELVQMRGAELLGRHAPQPRFPLLFKFLDAQKTLSVQVHPHDDHAQLLSPPDLGKTEAWVVLEAQPGSLIYAGLKRGFDRPALERELARGTCELCLHRFEPRPGDCVFLPAGMVHAIGAGLLVAEIQQSSDVTYRLFDWNRVGADGRPRPLHIEQSLDVIDFARGPAVPQTPHRGERPHVERLVECEKFVLDRWTFESSEAMGGDERCHLIAVLDGEVEIAGDPAQAPLGKGHTALLPAAVGRTELRPRGRTVLLDAYLP
ncbi:MAG TPA: type I phosphomannose isomerase catalytic subunit [Pirellulales bacterium]|nr:type I phosphomannose isomerase catalytic subunit [Pirellulales bacterium]